MTYRIRMTLDHRLFGGSRDRVVLRVITFYAEWPNAQDLRPGDRLPLPGSPNVMVTNIRYGSFFPMGQDLCEIDAEVAGEAAFEAARTEIVAHHEIVEEH